MENSLYYLWAQHKYFLLLKFVTVILVTNEFCIYVYVVNREENLCESYNNNWRPTRRRKI